MPDRRPAAYACEDDARDALLAAHTPADAGLPSSGAACLSMRWRRSGGAGFLITAGRARMEAGSAIAWVPLQDAADPTLATEEWRLHREIFLHRADVEAVVRCRPTFATTLACAGKRSTDGIPDFHPDVTTVAGGPVALADCGLPGSALRSEPLLAALQGRWSCLLVGWGLLACGGSLIDATGRAVEIEALARIWWHVVQLEHDRVPRPER